MSKTTLNILVIDDDEDDFIIVEHYLKHAQFHRYHVTWKDNAVDGLQSLLLEDQVCRAAPDALRPS